MCKRGLAPTKQPIAMQELATYTLLIQGNKSGTGLVYERWFKSLALVPSDVIVSDSVIALMGMTVSGLGISYLPRRCFAQWIEEGALDVLRTKPSPPPIRYVAMRRVSNRSALTASLMELTRQTCDFSRIFQVDR